MIRICPIRSFCPCRRGKAWVFPLLILLPLPSPSWKKSWAPFLTISLHSLVPSSHRISMDIAQQVKCSDETTFRRRIAKMDLELKKKSPNLTQKQRASEIFELEKISFERKGWSTSP